MYKKNLLVFSNGEKIGDGLIKLPFLNEIKKRLPDYKLIWITDKGKTVYNHELKNISNQFIDEILEQAKLSPFFWKKISSSFDLEKRKFDYILDTQKAVSRTIALKRIRSKFFISSSASGFFSNLKINKIKSSKRRYYLEDLYDLLDSIKKDDIDTNYKIPIPQNLYQLLKKIFKDNFSYIGIAPGAGEANKIWPIENFIEVGKFFQKKSNKIVFFLGPQEQHLKKKLKDIFPDSILPEEEIFGFSGPEIVMASTKYLKCALTNDSGISHMLSTNQCPIIKLFGPKNANKFSPKNNKIINISSTDFGNNDIKSIKKEYVINKMQKIIEDY